MPAHDTGGDRAPGDVLLVHRKLCSSPLWEIGCAEITDKQQDNLNESDTFVRFPIPSSDPNDPLVRQAAISLHILSKNPVDAASHRIGVSGARCSILRSYWPRPWQSSQRASSLISFLGLFHRFESHQYAPPNPVIDIL